MRKMKNMSKFTVAIILAVSFLALTGAKPIAKQEIKVTVNGKPYISTSKLEPIEHNGQIYIPIKDAGEIANMDAIWDAKTNTIAFQSKKSQTISLKPSKAKNVLKVGECGVITLKGNGTTGYSWYYKIDNSKIIKLDSQSDKSNSSAIGAGSTYTWKFKALQKGSAKITFKYYRSWEGETSTKAKDTLTYNINVK